MPRANPLKQGSSAHDLGNVSPPVDYFNLYNDTYGHQAEDNCLRAVARAININLKRPGDLADRYGGEGFAVILPQTDLYGAQHIAKIIGSEIQQLKIPHAL